MASDCAGCSSLLGVQAALRLNPRLHLVKMVGNELGHSAAFVLWAALISRHAPTRLMLGFNSMPRTFARQYDFHSAHQPSLLL